MTIEKKGAIPSGNVENSDEFMHNPSTSEVCADLAAAGAGLSEEKQIEEMAKTLTAYEKKLCDRLPKDKCLLTSAVHAQVSCDYCKIAEFLVNEGYRKQSEPFSCGHENGLILTIDGASGYFPKEFIIEAIKTRMSQSKGEWISVEERLPTEDEYLTHHNDRLSSLKRLTVAYMTDTIEYTIGCYDGYKWTNQLGNKKINDVVAWKPFELYEAPKGGAE